LLEVTKTLLPYFFLLLPDFSKPYHCGVLSRELHDLCF